MYTSTVNEVKILGYAASKPELRESKNGNPYCFLNIATHRSYVDQDGEIHTITDWLPVQFWGRIAINACNFLNKGSKVYIEGSLDTYSKLIEGERIYKVQVVASKMINLIRNEKNFDISDKKI